MTFDVAIEMEVKSFSNLSEAPITRLFVYGTLQRSDPSGKAALLGRTRLLGRGKVSAQLYNLGDYPGAVPVEPGDGWVSGDVHELDDFATQIHALDLYEGCAPTDPEPYEYRRELTSIAMEDGETITAWIYWYRGAITGLQRIRSGDWL
ncbi:MAG: gamma-glutamylcyclotransferase family protein [Chthoniobacterales bacterium]